MSKAGNEIVKRLKDFTKSLKNKNLAYCQYWEESEQGWGTRPDGSSLHLKLEEVANFCDEKMKEQKKYFESIGVSGVPLEYSRPCGKPVLVEISDELAKELKKKKNMRVFQNISFKTVAKLDILSNE